MGGQGSNKRLYDAIRRDVDTFEKATLRYYQQKGLNVSINSVRKKIAEQWEGNDKTHSVQDLFDAVTNKGYDGLVSYSHKKGYWNQDTIQMETFAHMFGTIN